MRNGSGTCAGWEDGAVNRATGISRVKENGKGRSRSGRLQVKGEIVTPVNRYMQLSNISNTRKKGNRDVKRKCNFPISIIRQLRCSFMFVAKASKNMKRVLENKLCVYCVNQKRK